MAGQFTDLQKSYKMADADGIAKYTGVVYAGEETCKKPTADNGIPLGVVTNDERLATGSSAAGDQTGRQIAVQLDGIASIKFAGVVTAGDRVILAAGGQAKSIADATVLAGTVCNCMGFAERSGIAGDVLPVSLEYHVFTK